MNKTAKLIFHNINILSNIKHFNKWLLVIFLFIHFLSFSQIKRYYLNVSPADSLKLTEKIRYTPPAKKADSASLMKEVQIIIDKLHAKGFLAASVDSIDVIKNEFTVYLNTGEQYTWLNLYPGNIEMGQIKQAGIKLDKYTGRPVHIKDFLSLKKNIVEWYNNHGYPFAAVKLTDVNIKEGKVSAILNINKHRKFTFDSIIVKGDANIHIGYLRNYLGIKKGDVYNEEKVGMADTRIEEIDFINALKPVEVAYKKEEADIYTYLQNQEANRFYGIAGLLSDPEEDQKLTLTGELDLLLTNSFGRGEQLAFNWQKLESTTQELDAMFFYPYLFSTGVGVELNFAMFKKDSSYITTKPGMLFRFYMTGNHYFKFFLRRTRSSLLQDDEEYMAVGRNYSNMEKNTYGLGYHISRLDNNYNPQQGVVFDIEAGYGRKTKERYHEEKVVKETGREFESVLLAEGYFLLWPKNVLKIAGQAGYMGYMSEPGSEVGVEYSENELFRIGGVNTLRGFNEGIILARRYAILSLEYRYLFEKNSNLFAFWDGAYYYNKIDGITEDFPFGFGVGANLASKAGIFSISYAMGKQFGNPIDIRSAKIHIGYINRFK